MLSQAKKVVYKKKLLHMSKNVIYILSTFYIQYEKFVSI
jgi:hypothetical protein